MYTTRRNFVITLLTHLSRVRFNPLSSDKNRASCLGQEWWGAKFYYADTETANNHKGIMRLRFGEKNGLSVERLCVSARLIFITISTMEWHVARHIMTVSCRLARELMINITTSTTPANRVETLSTTCENIHLCLYLGVCPATVCNAHTRQTPKCVGKACIENIIVILMKTLNVVEYTHIQRLTWVIWLRSAMGFTIF